MNLWLIVNIADIPWYASLVFPETVIQSEVDIQALIYLQFNTANDGLQYKVLYDIIDTTLLEIDSIYIIETENKKVFSILQSTDWILLWKGEIGIVSSKLDLHSLIVFYYVASEGSIIAAAE